MKYIQLTQGKRAIVDDEDFDELDKFKWCAIKSRNTFYGARKENGKFISMHQALISKIEHKHIDHVNGNGLDNRKKNLRHATVSENCCNRGKNSNNTSGFKGVSYRQDRKKWRSIITIDNKRVYLGLFKEKVEAKRAWNKAAIIHHGEFARLNN